MVNPGLLTRVHRRMLHPDAIWVPHRDRQLGGELLELLTGDLLGLGPIAGWAQDRHGRVTGCERLRVDLRHGEVSGQTGHVDPSKLSDEASDVDA